MEFLELVMLLAAVLLIWFKPEREKLAWGLAVGGWLMTVLIYVGHVSTGILGVLIFKESDNDGLFSTRVRFGFG